VMQAVDTVQESRAVSHWAYTVQLRRNDVVQRIRSAELLVQTAMASPEIMADLKAKPEEALKKLEKKAVGALPRALEQDKWIYRIVVTALSMVVLVVVIGVIYLTHIGPDGKAIPDVLTALGSAAIGALAGLLAPSPGKAG